MIEDVEDEIDELPDSDFFKTEAKIVDKINNGKDGVLPPSKYVELIETLWDGFQSKKLSGHLRKLDPNESGSLDLFPLWGVMWTRRSLCTP